MARASFVIGGRAVPAGARETIELPLAMLSTHTPMTLPVHVVHGRRAGPTLFVCAALHGDEVLGVEIIRRLMLAPALRRLRGTLLLIPIVNVFGFIAHSRYLPDRRDLNRSFPGSAAGSLASQLAHVFMTEIVARADAGIDLHTGAIHRGNLPQVRADFSVPRLLELGRAFGAPVLVHGRLRPGSLREAAQARGVDLLVYEAGEALRFDERAIRIGVRGVLNVMAILGMLPRGQLRPPRRPPVAVESSHWVRAPASGVLRAVRGLGDAVEEDELLGVIANPFGEAESEVRARARGIVIGRTNLPVVNQGDGLFHVAPVSDLKHAERVIAARAEELEEEILPGDPDAPTEDENGAAGR